MTWCLSRRYAVITTTKKGFTMNESDFVQIERIELSDLMNNVRRLVESGMARSAAEEAIDFLFEVLGEPGAAE